MRDYREYLSTNLKAFTGYCVAHCNRLGIKGQRLYEAEDFYQTCMNELTNENSTLGSYREFFQGLLTSRNYKYVQMLETTRPKYLYVLGKKFDYGSNVERFLNQLKDMLDRYNSRTTPTSEDWKALSQAVRVVLQCKELLTTGFIKFPLKDAEFIKEVKTGALSLDEAQDFIDKSLCEVRDLIETSSSLGKESNTALIDETLLKFVSVSRR